MGDNDPKEEKNPGGRGQSDRRMRRDAKPAVGVVVAICVPMRPDPGENTDRRQRQENNKNSE